MAITARTWVPGELNTAAKMNTLRDDLLELEDVAGFAAAQYGTITISDGNLTGSTSVSAPSSGAFMVYLGGADNQSSGASPRLSISGTTVTATRQSSSGTTVVNFVIAMARG